ncbi:MAG: P44/Msp2 family outer membrane protein [Alphaproteobacteria bacterium]|nr:P44/Msp2 family outer membrane protein [Alphaproteobacteria bacterium]
MKLKSAAFFTAAIMAFMTADAHANLLFDPYIGASVGVGGATTFIDGDTHSEMAQSYGAVIGLDIPFVRIEGEYNYLNDKDITAHTAMANAYLKMPMILISPYIGAGVGAILDGDAGHGIDIESTVAYQGMLGLTFDLPVLPFKIDAEARAFYAPDAFSAAGEDADLLHYDIRAKLRYIF